MPREDLISPRNSIQCKEVARIEHLKHEKCCTFLMSDGTVVLHTFRYRETNQHLQKKKFENRHLQYKNRMKDIVCNKISAS
jgi:hypothetical protein